MFWNYLVRSLAEVEFCVFRSWISEKILIKHNVGHPTEYEAALPIHSHLGKLERQEEWQLQHGASFCLLFGTLQKWNQLCEDNVSIQPVFIWWICPWISDLGRKVWWLHDQKYHCIITFATPERLILILCHINIVSIGQKPAWCWRVSSIVLPEDVQTDTCQSKEATRLLHRMFWTISPKN